MEIKHANSPPSAQTEVSSLLIIGPNEQHDADSVSRLNNPPVTPGHTHVQTTPQLQATNEPLLQHITGVTFSRS